MTGLSVASLLLVIQRYGYLIIFPIAVIEGPVISIISGFLLYSGIFNFFVLYPLLVAADLAGDSLYYVIGRFGGRRLISKFGNKFGIGEERLFALEQKFDKHHWKIIAIGKTQAIGSLILMSAGVARARFGAFLRYNLYATLPKTLLFVAIGYFFGHGVSQISGTTSFIGWASIGASLLLVVGYVIFRIYIKKHDE